MVGFGSRKRLETLQGRLKTAKSCSPGFGEVYLVGDRLGVAGGIYSEFYAMMV